MSARQQAGFRGPIRTCIEVENVVQSSSAPDAAAPVSQRTRKIVHNFDVDGRLISYEGNNGSSEWISQNFYDGEGRFLKSTSSSAGKIYHEVEYLYDNGGRLLSYISKSSEGRITSVCSYDAEGNKIVTTRFDPKVLEARRTGASAGPRLGALEAGFGVPDGGTVRTRYNQEDRPIEAQVLTLDGQVVYRVILAYDNAGRLVEEKQIMEQPEFVIPANVRAQMLLAGGSLEELRSRLRKVTGGEEGQHTMSYSYDERGRAIEVRTRIAPFMEQVVTRTYNSQGDVAEEVWVTQGGHAATLDGEGNLISDESSLEPKRWSVRHAYVYDDHGNWTEQTTSQSQGSDRPSMKTSTKTRTLSYY
jgi:YD repeat-containing protein